MTSFSKKAKAEAAKYKHQISPKARHKYTFNCGIGSKGFEPGNDCAGGKGKFDPTDWENTTFEERIIHKEPRGNHEVRLSDTEGPPIQERVEVVERFIDVVGKDRFLVSDKGVIFEGLTRNAAKLLSQEIAKIIPSYLIDVMENGRDVYSKDGKKRTFASDCGAGKQGSKGFQPGNTCGGDGDGKNDAGDQGGGDESSMWNNLDKFSDQEIGRMVSDNAPELEKDELEKLVAEGKKRGLIRDEVTAENILEQPGFADDAPAAGVGDYETRRQEIDDLEDSGEISSQDAAGLRDDLDAETGMGGYAPESDADAPSTEQIMEDMRNQQAELDAEIARLTQQNAEQKSAADADIAEAYKDVTEEDIQDMLEERDITAAEAEEMRGWVAQAQAAQADAPAADDAGDMLDVYETMSVDDIGDSEKNAIKDAATQLFGDGETIHEVSAKLETHPDVIGELVDLDAVAQADDADDSEFGPDDVLPRASEEAGLRQDQEYIDSLAADDAGDLSAIGNPVLSTGSGKIEIQLTDEAVRDGSTIHNTDMSHISDDLLREELMGYGIESDSANLEDRDSMEAALLELMDEDEGLSESELEEVLGPRASAPEAQGVEGKSWDYETDGKLDSGTVMTVGGASEAAQRYGINREGEPEEGTVFTVDRSNGYILSGRDENGNYVSVDTRNTDAMPQSAAPEAQGDAPEASDTGSKYVPESGFDGLGKMPMSSVVEKAAKDYDIPEGATGQEAYEIITDQGGHHLMMEDFYSEGYVDSLSDDEDDDAYSDTLDEFEAELFTALDSIYGKAPEGQLKDPSDDPADEFERMLDLAVQTGDRELARRAHAGLAQLEEGSPQSAAPKDRG